MSKQVDDLKRALSEGRIGRREFISRATALGMAAAIPLSILNEEARAAAPKRGGKLRQAARGGALSDSLDGALVVDTHPENTNWQCRNNVTQMMPDGNVGADLAESWEAAPDAGPVDFQPAQRRRIPQWEELRGAGCHPLHQPPPGRRRVDWCLWGGRRYQGHPRRWQAHRGVRPRVGHRGLSLSTRRLAPGRRARGNRRQAMG